jgi:hypothetical protein
VVLATTCSWASRPEHLKDAELVGADERVHGLTQGHRDRR